MSSEIRNSVFYSTFYSHTQHEGTPEKYSHKVQEPRGMFSMDTLQQAPKWPVECQVLPEKVRHIDSTPEKPEPFYFSRNSEPQPKPVGEEMGTVIYDYQPKLSVDYFCRSCVGGAEELQIFDTDQNTLRFESRFESGNLAKVIKVTNVYYELHLRPDMYTDRYSQWYYFRIQNTKENVLYRFSIVNLNKPDSLYRYGLKPLMYSEKNAQMNEIGWMRCGKNISYYKNDLTADDYNSSYTLTFNLKFRYNNDTVFIAQSYPYTYTKLQNYLRDIELDHFKSNLCQKRLLCKSLAGNNVYVLTITSPEVDEEDLTTVKKPVIVISARVHPGETPASYMMAGIIDFITSDCSHAQELRERFIFKLIPMLNPDGVIVGNSRCCLLGQDLNRQYRTVLREAFPQIYHTKVLLRRLAEENGIFLYCDLHGHSRRNNVFIYGCENRRIPERRLSEQVFPLMLHKNAADKFSFQSCKFKIQKSKEGTGRIFVWTLGVANSYTLEVSLGGSTLASRQYTHFNMADFEGLGRHFCETLLDYSDLSPAKILIREKILKKLMEGGSTAEEPVNIPITDYSRFRVYLFLSHIPQPNNLTAILLGLSHSESDNETSDDNSTDGKYPKSSNSPLKRQSSIRFSKSFQSRARPAKTGRATLSLTKASVDMIKIGPAVVPDDAAEDSLEVETVKKRRNNFGRSRTRTIGLPLTDGLGASGLTQSPKKYTKLLFDDPFNPPGLRNQMRIDDADFGGLSQTEDECDQTDSDFKNEKFLASAVSKSSDVLIKEMSSLRLSLHTKRLTAPEIDGNKAKLGNTKIMPLNVSDTPQIIVTAERRKSLGGLRLKTNRDEKLNHSRSQEDFREEGRSPGSSTSRISRTVSTTTITKIQPSSNVLTLPVPQFRRVSWAGGGVSPSASVNTETSTHSVGISGRSSISKKKSLRKSKSLGDAKPEMLPKSNSQTKGAAVGKDAFAFYSGSTTGKKVKKQLSKIKRHRSKIKPS